MDQSSTNGSPGQNEPMATGPIFTPPTDILEKKDSVVMLLDIPGADPESLDVTLDKRILTIRAQLHGSAPQGYAPAYIEFRDGTYERQFVFSEQMDGDGIDATLKDGVLQLTIPKAADTGARKISVKAA
jgi:HSP20 family protein